MSVVTEQQWRARNETERDLERLSIAEGTVFIRGWLNTSGRVCSTYGPYPSVEVAQGLIDRMRECNGFERYRSIEVHVYDSPRSHLWRGEARSPR